MKFTKQITLLAFLFSGSLVSSQEPVLNEFLASNESGIRDEDGELQDWIEIHNPHDRELNLDGWYLSDRSDDLARWRFPAAAIAPGGYLVVFASGKARNDPDSELHANFSLENAGEYLALVRPDGRVAQEFRPLFPPQRDNISYGLSAEIVNLIEPGAAADFHVPDSGVLGANWAAVDFAPGADWQPGRMGFGYYAEGQEIGVPPPFTHLPFDGDVLDAVGPNDGAHIGGAPTFVEGFDGVAGGAIHFSGRDYVNLGTQQILPVYNRPSYTIAMWVRGLPQNDRRIYSEGSSTNNRPLLTLGTANTGANGKLDVFIRTTGGTPVSHRLSNATVFDNEWHHVAWVDEDGSARVFVDGVRDTQNFSYDKQAMPLDISSIGAVLRSSACCQFTGDIDDFAVWDRALSAEEVSILATGGSPGAGNPYAANTATDVEAELRGRSSLYLRIPFEVEDPASIETLILRMKYDDGFVAYLNGIEVASANAPQALGWNSTATASHSGNEAITAESINLSGFRSELAGGWNVLAIHALNREADDESFLCSAELLASGALGEQFRYFANPSPGEPNRGGTIDFVADTRFSVHRGFFDAPFDLEIQTETEGAQIRFTTDGTEPTVSHGEIYDGPLRIERHTILRAAAFKPLHQPSGVDTQTYIFLDDVIRQPNNPRGYPSSWAGLRADYAMDPEICTDANSPSFEPGIREDLKSIPTLSIVMDPDDFMGSSRGIYVHPQSRGVGWERAASAELIIPDELSEDGDGSDEGFHLNCGVRMQGGSSARTIEGKHSFRLLFKSLYGPSKLRYRWFPDSDVDEFDTIVLRCFSTDAWAFKDGGSRYRRWDSTYTRDLWMKDSQLAMGNLSGHNSYVHLYVNGLYWGLYNPAERPDDNFQASHQGGEAEDWDIVKDFNELFRGRRTSWEQLMTLADSGLGSAAAYQRIQGNNPDGSPNAAYPNLLDVDSLIDYMILHIFACAEDWPHHNFYAARSRSGDLGGWRFFVWDQEIIMDRTIYTRNRVSVSNDNSPARIYSRLRANPEFRVRFGDRLQKHLFHDGALAVEVAQARWMNRADQIERAMVGESARWGDFRDDVPDPSNSPAELYTLRDHWIPARDTVLVEYIPDCNELALDRFRAVDLYPEVEPPRLSRHGGGFEPGFRLGLAAPAGSVYYTLDGTDPRLEGGALSPAALLAGSTASVELLASPRPATWVVPTGPDLGLSWTSPDFDDAAWSDGMSALGYERQGGYEDDFVTDVEGVMHGENGSIYMRVPFVVENPGAISFLSLSMKYDDGYVAYLNGVEVASRNAPADPQWNSRASRSHSDSAAVVFETLDISSHLDALVAGVNVLAIHGLNASVTSSDFLIVPEIGGGSVSESGVELTETTRFLARARLGVDWSALVETTFFTAGPLPLRISEIMYHSPAPPEASEFSGEDFDYLELVNTGKETISLEGARFTGGIRFDFSGHPMTLLEPGEVVLIVEDVEAFETRYDTRGMRILGEYEGKLDNGGEELWLQDALGEVIAGFEYSDSWFPLTDGQGLSLEIVDAGAAPESWAQSASWRAGQQLGSPGVHDFTPQPGGLQRLGDFNQDGELDISDPIGLLRYLFIAGAPEPPCAGGDLDAGGNLVLLDLNGDVSLDLSDAIYALSFLFAAGPPPVPGADCLSIEGCPEVCAF